MGKLLNETEQYKKQVIPIKQRNRVYARRSQEYLKVIEKSSRTHLNRHRYEKESIEKDLTRIRYEKKHKSLFKKFHTREGLELANHDAFKSLLEIDKNGDFFAEPEFESIYGYRKPKRKSDEAYQLLAKIERESEPEQIERRRLEDQYRASYSSKLDHVRLTSQRLAETAKSFSRENMSCRSAKRLRSRLYVTDKEMASQLKLPALERTNTQREIVVPKRRHGRLLGDSDRS